MASFYGSPLEIIEGIIDYLQDDPPALGACSQTCQSLLPLCRKYIFQNISFKPRWHAQDLPRYITLFGTLLDSNPEIANYVRNLVYQPTPTDFTDEDVPRILKKFHWIQSFRLIGGDADWNALCPTLRESLLHIIHLRSVTILGISYLQSFPINTFIPCTNLNRLTLTDNLITVMDGDHEHPAPDAVPQPKSFTFGLLGSRLRKNLVDARIFDARCSHDVPVLDFSNLRTLDVEVDKHSDLAVVRALMKVTEKLESLYYYSENGCEMIGLATSINPSSFSTLKYLKLEFTIHDDDQDPLCGFSAEIAAFSGHNVIEEIGIYVFIETDCQCATGGRWGMLDTVLSTGFPKLSQVSLNITIGTHSGDDTYSDARTILQEELNKLPEEKFPWLSKNSIVKFEFSTEQFLVY